MTTTSGQFAIFGTLITLIGVIVVARATAEKNRCLGTTKDSETIDIKKGLGIAAFSGVMSACFAFGIAAGKPIRELTLQAV